MSGKWRNQRNELCNEHPHRLYGDHEEPVFVSQDAMTADQDRQRILFIQPSGLSFE